MGKLIKALVIAFLLGLFLLFFWELVYGFFWMFYDDITGGDEGFYHVFE